MDDDATHRPARSRRWRPEDVVATACMALLVAITFANVVVRYLTDRSFAWTEELSVALMVVMVFAGAASAASRDAHLRVEVVYEGGGAARRRALRRLATGATVLAFGALAVLFARTGLDEWRWGETLSGIDWPRWALTAPIAALCALVGWRALRAGQTRR
jgi:TRAP-type C4-dicarboxylate transport system permease small subunit